MAGKRRRFSAEFKARVVLEEFTGVKDRAEICREYRLRPQVFSCWREEFLERAPEIFATEPTPISLDRSRPLPGSHRKPRRSGLGFHRR